jgi:hypothetical protein
MATATMDTALDTAERVAREVAKDPVGASVADLTLAIKSLTYERGALILTARRNGTADSPRVAGRVAKINAMLTQYAALLDAKRR